MYMSTQTISSPQESKELNVFSVLMSVYFQTKAEYLQQALDSIWTHQTLRPEQIVIVVDGTISQEVADTIRKWEVSLGETITRVVLDKNSGLAVAMNTGLRFCRHELVARMDSDDVSVSDRFEKQVNYFVIHPEVVVLGGQVEEKNEALTEVWGYRHVPTEMGKIERFIKYRSPLNHPSVMFRRDAILKVGGYPLNIYPEDYLLWVKLLVNNSVLANLPDVLLQMRVEHAVNTRRGRRMLIGELKTYQYLYQQNVLNLFEYGIAIAGRSALRLSPMLLKRFFYFIHRNNF